MTTSQPSSTLQMLVLERVDPARDTARYSVVSIDEARFGAVGFASAIERLDHLHIGRSPDAEGAPEALEIWLGRKRRRGCGLPRDGVIRPRVADAGQPLPAS